MSVMYAECGSFECSLAEQFFAQKCKAFGSKGLHSRARERAREREREGDCFLSERKLYVTNLRRERDRDVQTVVAK